tara:strand:- start:24 stop:137 length:114 start_codon:yes stop_codon:yes gene_type:complete
LDEGDERLIGAPRELELDLKEAWARKYRHDYWGKHGV